MTLPSVWTVTEIDLGKVGHRLVDRVVDHLVDQVMQPAVGGVADVHAGPLADMFEVREVLQVLLGVFRIGGRESVECGAIDGGGFRFGSVAHEDLQKDVERGL